jgi:hypothetical protein
VGLGAYLLIDVADIMLIRELVTLSDGELKVAGLEDTTLVGGKARLLGAASEDAALSMQRKDPEE